MQQCEEQQGTGVLENPALVADAARDSLPNPPMRICAELEALGRVKLVDAPAQALHALHDEVLGGHSPVLEMPCH